MSKYDADSVYGLGLKPSMDLRPDPSGSKIYAVGNVNGRASLLLKMIDQIENYGTFAANDKVVFLGNYIAETGNAERVLDILRSYQRLRPQQAIFLCGANEHFMLRAKLNFYRSDLGQNVLKSYRRPPSQYSAPPPNDIKVASFIRDQSFLNSLPIYYRSEKYFFVHAGVDPERELDHQNIGGFMFCRDALVKSDRRYDHLIIHSIPGTSKPEIKVNRIGISAGADNTTLNCLVLNDKRPDANPKVFGKIIENVFSVSLV